MGDQRAVAREAWEGAGVSRGAFYHARFVTFSFLALVVMAAAVLSGQRPALAQGSAVAEGPAVAAAALAQEKFGCPEDPNRAFEEGGGLCVSDWFAYLPLGIASVVFVILVDGVVFYYIYRKRQRGEQPA